MQGETMRTWAPEAAGANDDTRLLSDTTIFERFQTLSLGAEYMPTEIDKCIYMVTCNIGEADLAVAEVEYWGRFTDFMVKTPTGSHGLLSFNEFIDRIFFEMRVQTHKGRPDHTYDVVVKNGFDGEWTVLQKNDASLHDAVDRFHSDRKSDPDRYEFMWVNVVFVARPEIFFPYGASPVVVSQFLHRMKYGYESTAWATRTTVRPSRATRPREREGLRARPGATRLTGAAGPSRLPSAPSNVRSARSQAQSLGTLGAKPGPVPGATRGADPAAVPSPVPAAVPGPAQNVRLQRPLPALPSTPGHPTKPGQSSSSSSSSTTKKLMLSAIPKIHNKLRGIRDRLSPRSPTAKTPDFLLPRADEPTTPTSPTSVLTTLGAEIKQGGLHNLNGLLPSTVSPSLDRWRRCCRLIPSLDADQLALDVRARSIRLPHSKLCITPVQFYSAYQMLQGGSGLLCHDMGLGKTHTVIATAALKSLVVYSKKRCDGDRISQFASRHLPRDVVTRPGQLLRCPTQDRRPGDVECFCVPDGVTRQIYEELERSPGASLIHVPSAARGTWLEALMAAEFRTSSYNFRFVSKSADVPSELKISLETAKNTIFKMGATEKTKTVSSPTDLDWITRSGLDGLGTYIFIVLHNDTEWLNAFQHKPSELRPQPQRDCVFAGPGGTCYAAPIGLTFIDEAHLPGLWRSGSTPMVMARYHKHIVNGQTWFVTGTPFGTQGPRALEPALQLIDADLAGRLPRLLDLHQDASHKRTRRYVDDFTDEFRRVFSHDIVVRFTHQTRFLDQPVSSIQIVTPVVVTRRLPRLSFSKSHVQQLVDRGRERLPTGIPLTDALDASEAARQVRDELYFISLFPNATRLIASGQITVHERAMRESIRLLGDGRHSVHLIPEVQNHWEEVVRDSPKVRVIAQELDRMRKDLRQRRLSPPAPPAAGHRSSPPKVDPTWKKMVIVTPTAATAVYLYMYLAHSPDLQKPTSLVFPALYHQDLSQRQRGAIQDTFASLDRSSRAARRIDVVVGSFDAVGTGVNLQTASYEVLTSPLPRADDLAQAFARTNREGQKLPLEHRILAMEDSPVDRINMAALAQRDVVSDPFDVSARFEVRPAGEGAGVGKNDDHEDLYKLNQQFAMLSVSDGPPGMI